MIENTTHGALEDQKTRHQKAVLLPGMDREEAIAKTIENTRAGTPKMVRKVLEMKPGDVLLRCEPVPN